MPTTVRSSHDPFAPPVRFPEERLSRALDEDTVGRLAERFSALPYADARAWADARRTVADADLRRLYTVPEDATVETLTSRTKDELLELAAALGTSTTGTKDELARAILDDAGTDDDEGESASDATGAEGSPEEVNTMTSPDNPTELPASGPDAPEPGDTAAGYEAPGGDDAREADGPALDGTDGADGVAATGDPTPRASEGEATAEGTTPADTADTVDEATDGTSTTTTARRRRS